MKPVLDNLAESDTLVVSPFSDLKELISRNTKIDRKPKQSHFFVITFIPKHETTEDHNSGIIKKRSPSPMSRFFAMNDSYIINLASMNFLLDRIYIERPRSSYITPFLMKYLCSSMISTE